MVREQARRKQDAEALALVDDAVAFVTNGQDQVSDISRQLRRYTPDYAKWMGYRARLIEAARKLSE